MSIGYLWLWVTGAFVIAIALTEAVIRFAAHQLENEDEHSDDNLRRFQQRLDADKERALWHLAKGKRR